jgi:hypothetical protein
MEVHYSFALIKGRLMATILKVHGTFATGPEEGKSWWQRGSECCNHIGELVEAEDGNFKIEQVVWDGLNSERCRQAAAAKLLDRMTALDKAGEKYCVVGHSHGGSVISAALLRAAFYKQPLEHLSRWITVGTPFIEAKRSRLLFTRLGPLGKTIFLSALALVVGALFFAARTSGLVTEISNGKMPVTEGLTTTNVITATLIFAMLSYPILWLLARNRLYWHHARLQTRARQAFATKWLSLRHEDDEAVQGLGAFQSFKHPIFPRNFAVAPLSKIAIVLVPLAILLFMAKSSNRIEERIAQRSPNSAKTEQTTPAAKTEPAPKPPAPASATTPDDKAASSDWSEVFFGLLGFSFIFGIPVAIYLLVHWVARPTSIALSYGLNRMTWSQLRASSLGSDIDGESGRYARANPIWLDAQCPALPRTLATEISTFSDAAAGNSIAKFRAALSDLGFYRLEQDGKDALNAFLTGDELIHTTYFKIPRFRKLLAYAISQSPGFRPSQKLRDDPDFPLLQQWYKELEPVAPPKAIAA